MPTLQELALAQQNNANNPWLTGGDNPSSSGSGATPTPTNPNPDATPTPAPSPSAAAGNAVGQAIGQAIPAAQSAPPGVAPTPQPAAPAPKPTVPGATPLSPERQELAEENAATQNKQQLTQEAADSVQKQQDILTSGQAQYQDMMKAADIDDFLKGEDNKRLQSQVDFDAQQRTTALDQEAADARSAKVDPQRFFKRVGTAGSIAGALAIGAGAFAAAMPHTNNNTNQALSIINRAVDLDVESQNKDIENKFKSLNIDIDRDKQAFVKEHYMLNQRNEERYKAYDHAIAMANVQLQGTKDQAAAQGLTAVRAGLEEKKQDLAIEMARHRMQVAVSERAQAAAAAAADPFSALNTRKAYMTYRANAEKENDSHPDKPVGILSMADWLPGYQGQGRAGGTAGQANDVQSSIDTVTAAGQRASDATGLWTRVGSLLPRWLAPGANMDQDEIDYYNNSLVPGILKSTEQRLDPAQMKEQMETLKIDNTMPKEIRKERIAKAAEKIGANLASKGKFKSPTEATVPGATNVEDDE